MFPRILAAFFCALFPLSVAAQVFTTTDTNVSWHGAPAGPPAADLTGDGANEVLMTNLGSSLLSLHYVSPLQPQVLHPLVDVTAVTSDPQARLAFPRLADFDGNGKIDVLFCVSTPAPFGFYYDGFILFQQGGGVFSAPTPIPTLTNFVGHGMHLAVGDFNGDGRPDLGIAGELGNSAFDEVRFHLNLSTGWVAAPPILSPTTPFDAVAADFDGDGIDDLFSDTVLTLGSSGGNFVLQSLFSSGIQGFGVPELRSFGDMNEDGAMDMLAANAVPGPIVSWNLTIVFGGPAPFQTAIPIPLPPPPSPTDFPVVLSMNGDADGHPDLLVTWSGMIPMGGAATADFQLLRNRGGGLFGPVSVTSWGPWTGAAILNELVLGDFDGDGDEDAFHADRFGAGANGSQTTSFVRNDAIYGQGCAGTGGILPAFMVSPANPGNAAFALGITGARPQSWAILSVANAPPAAPTAGCGLLLDLSSLTPVSYQWTGLSGEATAHAAIPSGPALVGASLRAQWAVIDPGGTFPALGLNFALTPGRTITIF